MSFDSSPNSQSRLQPQPELQTPKSPPNHGDSEFKFEYPSHVRFQKSSPGPGPSPNPSLNKTQVRIQAPRLKPKFLVKHRVRLPSCTKLELQVASAELELGVRISSSGCDCHVRNSNPNGPAGRKLQVEVTKNICNPSIPSSKIGIHTRSSQSNAKTKPGSRIPSPSPRLQVQAPESKLKSQIKLETKSKPKLQDPSQV